MKNIKLTRKQKNFADTLLANPKKSATQVARETYNPSNDEVARAIGHENLQKKNIQQYLELHAHKALEDNLEIAAFSKQFASEGGKEGASYASVASSINKDIQDRTWGKARQQIEIQSTSLNLTIDLTSSLPQQGTETS